MVTTIQLDELTKSLLDKLKVHRRQSYNEIIEKMARERLENKGILNFAGAWSNLNESDIKGLKKNLQDIRKKSTKELLDDLP